MKNVKIEIDGKLFELKNYKIDEKGNVWSVKREKYLKPQKIKSGHRNKTQNDTNMYYYAVNLHQKLYYVHRLMWWSFKGFIPRGKEINHIDCDKRNNKLENIDVMTRSENIIHAMENHLRKNLKLEYKERKKYEILWYNWDGTFKRKFNNIDEACEIGFAKNTIKDNMFKKREKYLVHQDNMNIKLYELGKGLIKEFVDVCELQTFLHNNNINVNTNNIKYLKRKFFREYFVYGEKK